jgi:hypothetical protein
MHVFEKHGGELKQVYKLIDEKDWYKNEDIDSKNRKKGEQEKKDDAYFADFTKRMKKAGVEVKNIDAKK